MVSVAQIFKQIEIADNFLKYAKPGTEDKTRERARRRYDKALKMAMASADDQTVKLVKLRLNDLARTAVRDAEPEVEGYEPSGGSITASVERGVSLSYAELKALPLMEMRSDFHCVTGWSKLDNYWTGVKVTTILGLVVPKFYAWKSVKWVQTFELITSDKRGFWEVRGYHNRADPWLEERYSYQEVK
ncbi:MAG: hypothetical protein JJE05_01785 [Actinobacteria bacterium]|nr:hypothetical protein [Actinomycetota bacterium]